MCHYLSRIFLIFVFSSSITGVVASTFVPIGDIKPWSAQFYYGSTVTQVFGEALIGKYNSYGERIYALEAAYALNKDNLFRRIFSLVFDTVQIAGNLAYRQDYNHDDNVKEANLYVIWRFSRFPWHEYLINSIAIGDGVSYVSHPPFADRESGKPVDDFNRLLNYLMMEATFALPSHPEWELAVRLHHRCTAWGTFAGNANAGSTAVGLGLRYHF